MIKHSEQTDTLQEVSSITGSGDPSTTGAKTGNQASCSYHQTSVNLCSVMSSLSLLEVSKVVLLFFSLADVCRKQIPFDCKTKTRLQFYNPGVFYCEKQFYS